MAGDPREQTLPPGHPAILDAPVEADVDLFHLAAEAAQHVRRVTHVRLHLRIDLEVAEVHGEGDLPAADVVVCGWQSNLIRQAADVVRMGAGHDVLHQCCVSDAADHGAVMKDRL